MQRAEDEDRNRHRDQDCFYVEFAVEEQIAERDNRLEVLLYTATAGPESDQDRMLLDFYFDRGATDGPQSFAFEEEDPTECHTCLQIQRGCSDETCSDGQIFIPVEGFLDLDDMGSAGGPLLGEISDTLLTEVTIDPATNTATPVEDGETWCINAHLFDLVVE